MHWIENCDIVSFEQIHQKYLGIANIIKETFWENYVAISTECALWHL
jgi:hypothetical protein